MQHGGGSKVAFVSDGSGSQNEFSLGMDDEELNFSEIFAAVPPGIIDDSTALELDLDEDFQALLEIDPPDITEEELEAYLRRKNLFLCWSVL